MARSKKSIRRKKKNDKKSKTEEKVFPSVVGPDLFLLLQGRMFEENQDIEKNALKGNGSGGKNVSLILCGESHNDAVDVTRRSPPGKFDPTEGWIPVFDSWQSEDGMDIYTALPRALVVPSQRDPAGQRPFPQTQSQSPMLPSIEELALRYLHPVNGRKNKPVTLERARELAAAFVDKYEIEDDMFGRNLLLLWIATVDPGRARKGEAFLLEIETEAVIDEYENEDNDDDDDDSDEEDFDDWVFFTSNSIQYDTPLQQQNRLELPELVARWMDDIMMVVSDDDSTAATVDDVIDDLLDDGNDERIDENGDEHETAAERIIVNANEPAAPTHSPLGRYVLYEFGDLDTVAHDLTKRRLGMTDVKVTSSEYDDIIDTRKRALKEEDNVWTFDEWFDHVKAGGARPAGASKTINGDQTAESNTPEVGNDNADHAVHLFLEASVPPWEVELHRPCLSKDETAEDGSPTSTTSAAEAENFRLHPAAQCVRCLSEDSEASSEDEYDPSNDGIGSYIDFVYRRMMSATIKADSEHENNEPVCVPESISESDTVAISDQSNQCKTDKNGVKNWLHCIDSRDLGCESACHAESLKQQWYDILSQDEREILSKPKDVAKDACPVNERGDAMRFLPAKKLNPELIELDRLRSEGLLVQGDDDDDDVDGDEAKTEYEHDAENLEFTFPSFELFFGSISDNLYYSPNVKLAYSPFLVHCVESLDNWEAFFIALFFGGTIPEALERLDLRATNSKSSVHVRSPILQQWDPQSNSYVWRQRDEEEEYVTCPFFPFTFHLVAKGSSPPRTWSSQLFANLNDFDETEVDNPNPNSRRSVAIAIKNWILDSIQRNMNDPKASDDKECGGEWFASYLRAVHREIYDDIDTSDAAVLIQKKYMKSLTSGRLKKYNIGKIRIPSAKDAFKEVLARFGERESLPPTENVVTRRVEVLSKILIDIWMSNMFDFSLLLKIADVCANETKDNIVIVCYVGSAHARAASNFFCGTLGFQRKALVGKFTWEDDEIQTLELPSKLWNFSELFLS